MLPAASASALQLRGCGHCDQNCSVWLLLPESRRRRRPRGWHTGLCLATKLLEYMCFDVRCRGGQRNMFGLSGPQNKGRRFAARRHRRFLQHAGPKLDRNRLQLAYSNSARDAAPHVQLLFLELFAFVPAGFPPGSPPDHLWIFGRIITRPTEGLDVPAAKFLHVERINGAKRGLQGVAQASDQSLYIRCSSSRTSFVRKWTLAKPEGRPSLMTLARQATQIEDTWCVCHMHANSLEHAQATCNRTCNPEKALCKPASELLGHRR